MYDQYGNYVPDQPYGYQFNGVPGGIMSPYGQPTYNQQPMYGQQMPTQQSGSQNTIADLLSGLGKSGAAASYNFKGTNLGPQQNIADAMINNDNPLYQKLYGQNKQQGQQNLVDSIAELMRQNRSGIASGRPGLLNDERGGESVFRNLTRGYQDVQNQARQQTLGQLQGSYGNYNNLAQQGDLNNKKKAFGFGNIADALPLIAKLF